LPMMLNTPTVAESALPGFEMESWYGLWGPAKMPRELATRIASEVSKAVRSKLANDRLNDQGFKPVGSTADEFSAYINKEIARHTRIVREANIKTQ
jgi:tripartite-type tricarboxylate transporter receptor subunit TctC